MKKINLLLIFFLLFGTVLLADNSGSINEYGAKSVQKFLEAKQIEYKNSVKNNESVNAEEYKILVKKLFQI